MKVQIEYFDIACNNTGIIEQKWNLRLAHVRSKWLQMQNWKGFIFWWWEIEI